MGTKAHLDRLLHRAWDRTRAEAIAGHNSKVLEQLLRDALEAPELNDELLALDWAALKSFHYPHPERNEWFAFWSCFAKAMITQDPSLLLRVAELAEMLMIPRMGPKLRGLAQRPDNPALMRVAFLAAVRGRPMESFLDMDPRREERRPKGAWR